MIKIDDAENGDFFGMEVNDLIQIKNDLDDTVSQLSHKLVRLMGRQKEMENSISHNCDVVSAILQAYSSKKTTGPIIPNSFSIYPPDIHDETAMHDWKRNYRSLLRLSQPLPAIWRQRVWLTLAENYFKNKNINLEDLTETLFCPKLTPNDEELDYQIVKVRAPNYNLLKIKLGQSKEVNSCFSQT